MTATMYDATDPASIPEVPAPGYAMGYVDGRWPSYEGMRARFPSATPVSISAVPASPTSGSAQGCDGETGDWSPAHAAHFAATKLVLGVVPFIYCSWSAWHDYQVACTAVGVRPTEVDWGIASYPGIGPELYPGAVFHQFVDRGTYDESVVVEGWVPGRLVDPPPPAQEEYEIMDSVVAPNGDIVSHATTPQGHYLEITRQAGQQGTSQPGTVSVIDITDLFNGFPIVAP